MAGGVFFTHEEAATNFGEVGQTASIPIDKVKEGLQKCETKAMFNIIDDDAVMLDDNRNVLYPEGFPAISPQQRFLSYKKEVIEELITNMNGNTDILVLEQRRHAFSVNSGAQIMEKGDECPPFCD